MSAWFKNQPRHFSLDEISDILDTLAAHGATRREFIEDRDGWFRVGMALHHQFEGSEEGYERWCVFSGESDKFDEEDQWRVWKSFGKRQGGTPLTLATLQREANVAEESARTGSERPEDPEIEIETDFVLPPRADHVEDEENDNPFPFETDFHKRLRVAMREWEDDHERAWKRNLDTTDKGNIRTTVHNVSLIVSNDWRLQGWLGLNTFTGEQVQTRPLKVSGFSLIDIPQRDAINGDKLTKIHDTNLRLFMAHPPVGKHAGYGMSPSDRDLKSATDAACQSNRFHPIRAYLSGLHWDGVERLTGMFIRFLGCPDDAYHRQVAQLTLVAGVARVFEPGCKYDYAVILEGREGLRKSTFIRGIAAKPCWFGELTARFNDRNKLVEQMMGAWQVEMSDLSGFNKSAVADAKAFMSARSDNVRLAYEARAAEFLRQCIIWGSTNDRKYLQSETGDRRFWPVEVLRMIDTEALAAIIDQLWAEAVQIYRVERSRTPKGLDLPLYLRDPEAKRLALQYQGSRKVEKVSDIYAGQIEALVEHRYKLLEIKGEPDKRSEPLYEGVPPDGEFVISKVCALSIHRMLGNDRPLTNADITAYNIAMSKLKGWEPGKLYFGEHGQQRGFKRIGMNSAELRNGYTLVKKD